MLFNSYIFILLFLPICIIGFFSLNRFGKYKWGTCFLLLMSLWYYAYYNVKFLPVILVSVIINYSLSLLINHDLYVHKKLFLILGLVFNIGFLAYFKYVNFFIETVNSIFTRNISLLNLALPLGISFFTFQQISFLVDNYRGEVSRYGFIEYAAYVCFFPQLIAGPIVSHDCLVPQLLDEKRRGFDWNNFARGIYLFSVGLAKKVLIADSFGNVVNYGFANTSLFDATNGIIVILAYSLQIYFDFSGYCDMAMGIAQMMNIDLPLNFDAPYQSSNILEFWDRWHMTLTKFFTKYVYIPLGGSRRGNCRTYFNVMIVFLLSGLWHGAGWNFVVWGGLHGLMSVLTRVWKSKVKAICIPRWLGCCMTFVFVSFAWFIFRADNLLQVFELINQMCNKGFGAIDVGLAQSLYSSMAYRIIAKIGNIWVMGLLICLIAGVLVVAFVKPAYKYAKSLSFSLKELLLCSLLIVWSILSLSGVSTFLYFNF